MSLASARRAGEGCDLDRDTPLTRKLISIRFRPLPIGEVAWSTSHHLAASLPECVKERRERGRRSAAILLQIRAAFRRPRASSTVAEGALHDVSGGARDRQRLQPLPKGVRTVRCLAVQPRVARPGI